MMQKHLWLKTGLRFSTSLFVPIFIPDLIQYFEEVRLYSDYPLFKLGSGNLFALWQESPLQETRDVMTILIIEEMFVQELAGLRGMNVCSNR